MLRRENAQYMIALSVGLDAPNLRMTLIFDVCYSMENIYFWKCSNLREYHSLDVPCIFSGMVLSLWMTDIRY
jgi:hypothetical protein